MNVEKFRKRLLEEQAHLERQLRSRLIEVPPLHGQSHRHWFRLMSCANEQYVWTLQPYRVMILPRETSCSSGGEHGIGADSMYRLWWSERRGI